MAAADEPVYSLGAWLRRRRNALDLTQAALAQRVGCAAITIRKLEADEGRPSQAIAERLATCLALAPDERLLFLQVARGERSVDGLPSPRTLIPLTPSAHTPLPPLVEPLPLDRVPLPAPLPSGSRMPLRRNPLFVGRAEDLRALAQALTAGGTAAIGQMEIAAATGLGGIGKTQLACEFVHRYGQYFVGGVFWLSFADPAAVPGEVAACGGADGMQLSAEFDTLPLEQQVRQVLTAWKQPIARLLVFDNCEDEALLVQWQPTHGGCRILLTSRRHHWDAVLGVQAVPLDVLPRSESIALLRYFRQDLSADEADLDAIADTLGDLPLALHLAGSFLAHYRHVLTPAHYLERLQVPTILDDRSLQAAGLSPTRHVQHVARTFEQSYARLDPADPIDSLARTLLAHAAYFAPGEPLPRWLLLPTLDLPEGDAEQALVAEDALTRLIDLGLLETDAAGNLRLHRLLAAFVQAVLVDAAAQALVEATMLQVIDDLNRRRNPRPVLAIQPHLRFLTKAAQPQADARAAGFCHALGVHLWQLGLYAEAQRYLEQAVAIYQRVLGSDHPDTATSLTKLGNVLWTQGQAAAAQGYYEQALAIRQRVQGPDHPHTAMSLNNLGTALEAQGQYAAAQHYYEQALAIQQRLLGEDHPDTARSLHNLGIVLHDQRQYTEARHSLEQAVAIRQRMLGEDHPHTARSLRALGMVLHAHGDAAQAQSYLDQALTICVQRLGPQHPDTAESLHQLGLVLHTQGQDAEAQRFLEQALTIRQRVQGPDHPDTARSLKGLGELLHTQGETAQARHHLAQALAIFTQRLGSQHPDTEQTRQALAALDSAHSVGDSAS